MSRYWTVVFTGKTWDEFVAAGGREIGFRERRRVTAGRMTEGDKLLAYISGVARWIAVLEVVGKTGTSERRIFSDEDFPVRLPVRILSKLEPDNSVPIASLLTQFSWWDDSKANRWGVRFQYPPSVMADVDGKMVERAISAAAANPISDPVDRVKWSAGPRQRKPRRY